ncbi:MAG TPA: hypothetical protein VEZ55_03920 [Chitinophagaceae bacterium]|nr:hypothetical protein [Chitinophagaceae bacterium]
MARETKGSGTQSKVNNANKGESQPRLQKGAKSTSNKKNGKHEKDDSSGSERNTTKRQGNSI